MRIRSLACAAALVGAALVGAVGTASAADPEPPFFDAVNGVIDVGSPDDTEVDRDDVDQPESEVDPGDSDQEKDVFASWQVDW